MSTGVHLITHTWRPAGHSFDHGFTVWKSDNSDTEFIPLNWGDSIAWSINGPRKCIGYRGPRRRHPCPENRVIVGGGVQCGPCVASDYYAECVRCNGSYCKATPERREECRRATYAVYIAVFSDRSVKVGVSAKGRVKTRWLEQGADYAGVLLEVEDGMRARQIESSVGRSTNATVMMSGTRKAQALVSILDRSEAEALVANTFSGLDAHGISPDEIVLEDLSEYYAPRRIDTQPLPWRKRGQQIDDLSIIGQVAAMKGSILVTKNGAAYQYIDLKTLRGFRIIEDSANSVVMQSGLLDFM
ncbi:MAG: DUF2797 domain-containing protein [Candidatus Thorarchaeota archaeon]